MYSVQLVVNYHACARRYACVSKGSNESRRETKIVLQPTQTNAQNKNRRHHPPDVYLTGGERVALL